MALSEAEKKKNFLKKHGLPGFNKCVIRSEGGKKGKVGILVNGKPKLIRFGDASMGHNYSAEARKSFKARHAKNIAKGPKSVINFKKDLFTEKILTYLPHHKTLIFFCIDFYI